MSAKSPIRLSIIMTCHLKTPWFVDALESILNCKYHFENTEILICDDASPSGGDGDTAREYQAKYPELIKVLRNDQNIGQAPSLTRLHEASQGEYLMLFDSDDIMLPFDIDGNMDFLDKNIDYAGVYGKKRMFDGIGGDRKENQGVENSFFTMLFEPCIMPNAIILRSSDVREVGSFLAAPGTAWDIYLWMRLGEKKDFLYQDAYRLFYRHHSRQLTKLKLNLYKEDYRFLGSWLIERHPDWYEGLKNRSACHVEPAQRRSFVMLCGYMAAREISDNAHRLWITDAAAKELPSDYGIFQFHAFLLMKQERYAEALAEAFGLVCQYKQSVFIRLRSWTIILNICNFAKLDETIFKREFDRLTEEYFRMSDEEKIHYERTLQKALAYKDGQ